MKIYIIYIDDVYVGELKVRLLCATWQNIKTTMRDEEKR